VVRNRDEVEVVKVWRVPECERMLLMHGVTTSYRVDPRGEYVIGVSCDQGFRATRGRHSYAFRAGDLAVWDPSGTHAGSPLRSAPWEARLLVIELPELERLAAGAGTLLGSLEFPDPVVRQPSLTAEFLELHRALEQPASSLERQSALATFLERLAACSPSTRLEARPATAGRALRRACEYLLDAPTTNVSLDDLAEAADCSPFHLVRLFRRLYGVPPHRFQIGQRVVLARRLLEQGASPSDAAIQTGFYDQSHLHRHFTPRLGLTPRRYAAAFRREV
jgi:AraC-like DNA-binding protein